MNIPIAHGEGNYYCDDATLKALQEGNQIVFTYANEKGEVNDDTNPNGSRANIAGICNKPKNVLGMMPHPERVTEPLMGSSEGLVVFRSMISAFAAK